MITKEQPLPLAKCYNIQLLHHTPATASYRIVKHNAFNICCILNNVKRAALRHLTLFKVGQNI